VKRDQLIQDGLQWQTFVIAVMNFLDPFKYSKFADKLNNHYLFKKCLVPQLVSYR
jgi:hypothetical protein